MLRGFIDRLQILKEKNKGKIVLVKAGAFYVGTGEDAVLLHEKLDLKCTCFKNNECKVGFPINSLDKYIEKMNNLKYAYIIYDYDKQRNELIEINKKIGKCNNIKDKNINCLVCKGSSKYEDNKYIKAVQKLLEEENG